MIASSAVNSASRFPRHPVGVNLLVTWPSIMTTS